MVVGSRRRQRPVGTGRDRARPPGPRSGVAPGRWAGPGAASGRALVAAACLALVATGCLATRVPDLERYDEVPLDRVEPYPTKAERRQRSQSLAIVSRPPGEGGEAEALTQAETQLRRRLERIAREAGAILLEPSASAPGDAETASPDLVLMTRFVQWRHEATWQRPARRPWQSEAELARRPGTCTHRVGLTVELILARPSAGDPREPGAGAVLRRWLLVHGSEQAHQDVDPACTLSPASLAAQLESTLDEALRCLERPLAGLLAPRGHVTALRRAPDGQRALYRITLGSAQGLSTGDEVEIRRPAGPGERVLAVAVVTDRVEADRAWVALDPTRSTAPVLAGDVVRRIEREGLLESLTAPRCDAILASPPAKDAGVVLAGPPGRADGSDPAPEASRAE